MYEGMMQLGLAEKLPVVAVYTSSAYDLTDPVDYYPESGPSVHVKEYQPFIEP